MAKKQSAAGAPKKKAQPQQGAAAPRKRAVPPSEKNVRRKLGSQEVPAPQGFIDDRTKRTIIAILCIVCAVALLLIVVWPSDAVVASLMSQGLHQGLGIGAYILPLVLVLIGFVFIGKIGSRAGAGRIIAGLLVIYIGLLVLSALATPGAVDGQGASTQIFADRNTTLHGGLVGAGPAFVLLMLLGLPVSVIITLGIIAVGFAIVGFSLRRILAAALARRQARREREEEELSVVPDSPYVPATAPVSPKRRIPSTPSRPLVDDEARTRLLGDDADPGEGLPQSFPEPPGFLDIPSFDDEAQEEDGDTPQPEPLPPITPADLDASRRRLSESLGGERRNPRASGQTQMLTRRLGHPAPKEPAEPEAAPAQAAPEAAPPKKKQRKPKATPAALEKSPDDTFALPDLSLLKMSKGKVKTKGLEEELQRTAQHLQQTMEDFGIMASVVDWIAGPTVTLFEVDLPPGVRVSRLMALKDDIALALAAPGVRIFAPIPKTHYVGIEVPNAIRENVLLGDILKSVTGGPLEVAIGKDVEGHPIIEDLARMPHLLIGGTTGSGKSVGINAMIMSILMRATPSQVRFIMIDPKRVEFAPYDGIPHLYVPVVTEPKEAASALSWGVAEMDLRLKTFEGARVRNISSYNALVYDGTLRRKIDEGELAESKIKHPQFIDEPMPYIVIVIDELADLMMNVGKEVEFSISRIAQLARAAGIHLIVATQRPSANVVTGLIKANITTRIAYNVASGLDSRVILDTTGAESLIGLGDLLISKPEYGKPLRVQGCYTSDEEIAEVVEFIKAQGEPDYHSEILKTNLVTLGDSAPDGSGGTGGGDDPLVWEAAEIVVSTGMGSTSNIQRKLKVGYARAGRIMDMLEEKGVVGAPNGSKPREVLVDAMELETLKAFEAADERE